MDSGEIKRIVENVVSGLHKSASQDERKEESVNTTDNVKRVALGADHGGYEAKEAVKRYLETLGYRVTDVGTGNKDSVDYPDFAVKVARNVASGECERGIMIDGAGIGSWIGKRLKIHQGLSIACH